MTPAASQRVPSNHALAAWAAGAAAAISCGAIAFLVGGAAGLLYLFVYVLATLPGWPLGFALFGRRHAAGWLSGALLGYAVTSLAFWAAIRMGYHSAGELATIWAVLALAVWVPFALAAPAPVVSAARWTRRDTLAICLIFLLVAILCGQPFRKVGIADPDGTRAYRAYFTMDFFWHTAIVAEVSKFTAAPRNPFWASEPLHYYWTYFIVPSAVIGNAPARLALEIEPVLLINAMMTAMLLAGMVFVLAWMVVPRPGVAGAATALVILSASAEGTYALLDLLHRGRPLAWVRDLNIDAMTAWAFGGLRVDDLPRSFWWVPQHATACALGLVALAGAASHGARGTLRAIAIEGVALGGAVLMSPFLGAAMSGVYGVSIAADALAEPRMWLRRVAAHAAAAVPVVAALGWCVATGVLEGTSGAMKFGIGGLAAHAPVLGLLLSLGPVLLPALGGLWPPRGVPRTAIPALSGLAVGLAIFYLVRMPLDEAYVGFRAGQVMLISLPGLVALAMTRWWDHPRLRTAGIGLFAVLFSHRPPDDGHRLLQRPGHQQPHDGAGIPVDPDADPGRAGSLPVDPARHRTPGHRAVRAGLAGPRFLVDDSDVRAPADGRGHGVFPAVRAAVRRAVGTRPADVRDAGRRAGLAHRARPGCGLHLCRPPRARRGPPVGLDKFSAHPEEFPLVFSNAEVRIYAVAAHAPQARRGPTGDILLADAHGFGISGPSPSSSR